MTPIVSENVNLAALVLTAVVDETEQSFASPGAEPLVLCLIRFRIKIWCLVACRSNGSVLKSIRVGLRRDIATREGGVELRMDLIDGRQNSAD